MEIKAITVKKTIREAGIDTKKISVAVKYQDNGDKSITVTVKDINISLNEVTEAVSSYRDVRYDENVQGELLQGSNTFVICNYDYEVLDDAIDSKMDEAEAIYSALSNEAVNGEVLVEDEEYTYYAFKKENIIKGVSKLGAVSWERPYFTMENSYQLAEALVFLPNTVINMAA